MPISGQLWYGTRGFANDLRVTRVGSDGLVPVIVEDDDPETFLSQSVSDIAVDTALGIYFAIVNDPFSTTAAYMVRGTIGGGDPVIVADFRTTDTLVNGFFVDPASRRIFLGVQEPTAADGAQSGIRQYSYDAAGTVSGGGFIVTQATANKPPEQVDPDFDGIFAPGPIFAPNDFDFDPINNRLYFTESLTGLAQSQGLFSLNLDDPTVITQVVSQTQFPDNGSAGFIRDVEVDAARGRVYFSVVSDDGNAAETGIWTVPTNSAGATAIKLTLPGLPAGFYADDIAFDAASNQLYVEDGESSGNDVIYIFQLNGTGTSGTLLNTITPAPFADDAAIAGMIFTQLPTLTAAATATPIAAGGPAALVFAGTPLVTDPEGWLTGATVQITTNRQTGDVLSTGTVAGITSTYDAATGTLTLTGVATAAAYQAAISSLRFATSSTASTSRTITTILSDGSPDVPAGSTNTSLTTFAVSVNAAPVLDLNGAAAGETINATFNEGTSAVVAPDATLTDTDSANFDGGTLTVSYGAAGTASDFVSVQDQGGQFTMNGRIGVASSGGNFQFYYNTVLIGTAPTPNLGSPLVVTFNANATPLAAQALVRAVTTGNLSDTPPTSARPLTFTVTDGDGGTVNVVATITVTAVNDAPVNTVGGTATGPEDATFTLTGISVSDVDANPATQNIQVQFSVANGALTLATNVAGGLIAGNIVGNGTATITVTATQNAINATLASAVGLRYTAGANYNGTDALTVVTNDLGASGADPGQTGNATSEQDTDVKAITIAASNDAPVVVDTTQTAATILEDQPSATGQTVASLFGPSFSDSADQQQTAGNPTGSVANTFAGIAIVAGSTSAAGSWQYFDGTSWTDIGAVSQSAARTIAAGTAIRFNPAGNFNGSPPALTAHLIDSSSGGVSNTNTVSLTGGIVGGNSRWSADTVALSQEVNSINDAPVIARLTGDFQNFFEGDAARLLDIDGNNLVTDVDSANFAGGSLTVAITAGGDTAEDVLGILAGNGVTVDAGAGTVSFNGVVFGTISSTGTGTPLVIAFDSDATIAAVQALLTRITYLNTDTQAPTAGGRAIDFVLDDGDGTANGGDPTGGATTIVTVVAVDDAPVAAADSATVAENATVLIDLLGNDTDVDGGPKAIATINGTVVTTGTVVTLASGATVTNNGNGTVVYNPNGAFNTLPGAGSGASTTAAINSFGYTLNGGNSATVAVTVTGVDSNDTLIGTAGADTLTGGIGNDTISGLAGNDTVNVNVATDGADMVDLGDGADVVNVSGPAGQVRLTFRSAGVGNDNPNDPTPDGDGLGNVRFQAENGSDGLTGPASRYDDEGISFVAGAGLTFDVRDVSGAQRGDQFQIVVLGTLGADVLTALQSARPYYFNAGMGDDTITGGDRDDFLVGGGGADALDGSAGNDSFIGGAGNDTIVGGLGNDLVLFDLTTGEADTITLGDGADVVQTQVFAGQIRLTFLSAGVGNGVVTDSADGLNNVRLQTEDGADGLTGPISRIDDEGITFVAAAGQTFDVRDTGGAARGDQFQIVVLGTIGADVFTAIEVNRPYYFNAGMGDDSITGGTANDFLVGGAGVDTLDGGQGNDSFIGGGGDDTIVGGLGDDTVFFDVTTGGADTITLGDGADTVQTQVFAGQIRLTFTSATVGNGDALDTDGLNNVRLQIEDGAGVPTGPVSRIDDEGTTFAAAAGQNFDVRDTGGAARGELFEVVVLGTAGADTLTAVQAARSYYFNAGAGDDSITGGTANDFLVGNGGNDTLAGGAGNDTSLGGAGTDTATFASAVTVASISTLADFDTSVAGPQPGYTVAAGTDGTDVLSGVEIVDGAGTGRILLVGSSGFADLATAQAVAVAGDLILVAGPTAAATNEDAAVVLTTAAFGFIEVDGDTSVAVLIDTLPPGNELRLNGVAVTTGQSIAGNDIIAGRLSFVPPANATGAATVTFRLQDGAAINPVANTLTVTVAPLNDATTITNLQGDIATFTEGGDALSTPIDLGQDLIVGDVDSANFDGGTLVVRVTTNKVAAEDQLFFTTGGTTGLAVSGNIILFNGVQFATFTPGGPGVDRTFAFNANATPAAVQALLRGVTYFNAGGDNPTAGQRTIEVVFTDGDGGTTTVTSLLNVVAVNDPPVLTGFDSSVTFAEADVNAGPRLLDADVTFGDSEGNFAGGTVTVSGQLAEDTVSIRNQGTASGQVGFDGTNVTFGGTVIGTVQGGAGATLTVTLNVAATAAAVETLVENLTYANASDAPTASRTLVLNITDGTGAEIGGDFARFAGVTGAADPFNGIGFPGGPAPTFVDLDGDGDRDAVIGNQDGTLRAFSNNGAGQAFTELTGAANPFAGIDVGFRSTPSFVDLDGDGDLDAVVGEFYGTVRAFANNGAGQAFTPIAVNPFAAVDVGEFSNPAFVDLDGDGDLDALIGEYNGSIRAFRNQGSGQAFVEVTGADNPLSGINVGRQANPGVVDLDGDGDLDVVVGDRNGGLRSFRNNGVGQVFTELTGADDPFAGAFVDGGSTPGFVDIDGEGDLDAIVGQTGNASLVAFRNTPGGGQTIVVTVVADAPIASADTATVAENATTIITVLANDTDVDGVTETVAAVDGQAIASGQTVTLASGALVTLNADGTLTYNPNGRFDYLVSAATALATGAVNDSAADPFTYQLNGASTATVSVTVTGVDGPGSQLRGDGGDDTITGTPGADFFNVSQGGDDDVAGQAGNDVFYFGAALTAADQVDGGEGRDVLAVQGNYLLQLGAGNLVGVETLSFLAGNDVRFGATPALNSYLIASVDENVVAGAQLIVNGGALLAGETLAFDGSAETDGSFLFYGGRGTDILTGGAQADIFYMADDRYNPGDRFIGGGGNDIVVLRGDYVATLEPGTFDGIETLSLASATDTRFFAESGALYSYDITSVDGNVAADTVLTVNGGRLVAGEVMRFDGSAELDGAFRLFGGAAGDLLLGGGGDDLIYGGLSSDSLNGGAGNDVFRYLSVAESTVAASDSIGSFDLGDLIDLGRIDADSTIDGDQAFSFIGAGEFTGQAGQLRAVPLFGPVWGIQADVDGDGVADLQIYAFVANGHQITQADFVL